MVAEHRVVGGEWEGFLECSIVQNLDLGCAHIKFHQAEHLRFVLLNVCKLFLSKNNFTYIKKKRQSLNKNTAIEANKNLEKICQHTTPNVKDNSSYS